MILTPGNRLGPYEVLAPIGAGGMGEVYRARDTKLGRDVALKLLPDLFADDPERLARFQREAQVLASLNHPHIAQIYGLEDSTGVRALVMELVDGPTLADRIAQGPIPLDDAISIAKQIALALEAAHERGIVHRDLKPANVKVRGDGAVKVLDFGLARAFDQAAGSSASAMNSPTITSPATQAGVILGTAAYMAPEQAKGRTVDKRADIWAFGCVLYEMLTAKRPFPGDDVSDTIAAVLRADVDWATLPAGTPPELTRLLRRSVERDLTKRFHDIADVRIELEEIARGPRTPAAAAVGESVRPGWLLSAAVATGVAALAIGLAIGRWTNSQGLASTRAGLVRLVVQAPDSVTDVVTPALSPDGTSFAFFGSDAGKRQIYVHRFSDLAPHLLPGTEGARSLFMSPDGKWIAFRRSGRLERIAIDGSDPITVTDIPEDGPGGAWGPDGTIVIPPKWYSGLLAVPASGGTPRPLTTLNAARNEKGHWFPQFLPDGRHVIFTVWYAATGLNDADVAILDLGTGTYHVLFPGACASYISPGALVFYRAGSYQAVRFDSKVMTTSGEPFRVFDDAKGLPPDGSTPSLVTSPTGIAAYIPGRFVPERSLAWVSAGGRLDPLPYLARSYGTLSIAPDARRAVVSVLEAGRWVLHLLDFDRRTDDPLDFPGSNWTPVWHPDGRRLAFLSMRKGTYDIYWKDTSTSDPPTPLVATDRDESPGAWLPDGRALVLNQEDVDGKYHLKLFTLDDASRFRTLTDYSPTSAVVSPDGMWLAFTDDHTGRGELYIRSLTGNAAAERISSNGAAMVGGWTKANGLYLRPPEVVAVTFRTDSGRVRVEGERIWARVDKATPNAMLYVASDGRVLISLPTDQLPPQIRVVLGWDQEPTRQFERR